MNIVTRKELKSSVGIPRHTVEGVSGKTERMPPKWKVTGTHRPPLEEQISDLHNVQRYPFIDADNNNEAPPSDD